MSTGGAVECECKIGRQMEKYGLSDLNGELRHHRREEEASLRDLADFVNARIVEAAIDAADADVAGDGTSVYVALADDDVSTERRVNVTDQLTSTGIDVDELEGDFVSYQSVRTHLRNCLDVDTGRRGVETVEEGREVIEWARARDENVIERTLSRLQRVGAITAGELTATTTITVECTTCGTNYRLGRFLDRGACECADGTDSREPNR